MFQSVMYGFAALLLLLLSLGADRPLAASLVLGMLLLSLSYVDIRTRRLPNSLNLMLFCAGWIYIPLTGRDILPALLSFSLAVLLLGGLSILFERLRKKKGLGAGDVKLFAAASIWLPPTHLAICLLITSATALMMVPLLHRLSGEQGPLSAVKFALGPYLSFGVWITWLFGGRIMGF